MNELREAPLAAEVRLLLTEANGVESRKELHHWRRAAVDCLEHYAALLESSDIILIRRDAEGNWPEQAVSVLMSYLYDHDGTPFTGNPLVLVESALDALSDSLAKEGEA